MIDFDRFDPLNEMQSLEGGITSSRCQEALHEKSG